MRLAALVSLGTALVLALPAPAQSHPTLAVHCGKIYLGDGRVLQDAWLLVKDGLVQDIVVGKQPPAGMPVVDAKDKVVIPGLVAADCDLSGHQDSPYQVTPDFKAIDGFDLTRSYKRALSGGVTTAYLAPGRNRLVPGQGSVVKLFGDDLLRRVLAETNCLRLTLGRESTQAPALFEPTAAPTSDDPLLPARKQWPSARISQLHELRRIFAEAEGSKEPTLGPGAVEDQYEVSPLRRANRGELPLRIAAKEPQDLQRALLFAQQLKCRLVLEQPVGLDKVASAAAAQGALAVFRVPVRPGVANPGGEDRALDRQQKPLDLDALATAAAAGVPVALAPGNDDDLDDFLLVAALAIRHGLTTEQALLAITANAARALGVDQQVGTLTAGKHADFLVLSGEPFAIGTLVEKTYVDGVLAYSRDSGHEILAVRATRVMTGDGRTLRSGVILVEDGKIKAVGEDLSVPYGARVLDIEGTVVPGFIDACTHMGLSGESQGIPNGAPDQLVADAVRHDDPLFKKALEAGVTTALVAGRDGAPISGRVAALKTGARNHAAMVLKETAAIRLVQDAIGPEATRPLSEMLERTKRYVQAFVDYEKSLKDPNAAKPVVQQPAAPAADDPISGTWSLELKNTPIPVQITILLFLKLEGTKVTGKSQLRMQGRDGQTIDIQGGTFENGTLVVEFRGLGGQGKLEAKVEGDRFEGTLTGGPMGSIQVSGTRTSKDESAPAAGAGPGSNKPRIDQSQEPLRALLEKKIPAIVRSQRAPAIEAVVKWFEEQKLPYVLTGIDEALETPETLGGCKQVLLAPEAVQPQTKQSANAAKKLAERGVRIALGSHATAGSRYLPVHAAYAVRYGLDPETALAAITMDTARMFQIDDRVGSLARGKDADFVVFSGNPFEMESRVLLVVCNGEIVVDRRVESRKERAR